MNLTRAETYAGLAEELKEKSSAKAMKRLQKVIEFVETLTIAEHLTILDAIILGHRGAETIRISYHPVGIHYLTAQSVTSAMQNAGWEVSYDVSHGFIISNSREFHIPGSADYSRCTYQKQTFWLPEYLDYRLSTAFPILKDYIRVTLWNLQIDESEICT